VDELTLTLVGFLLTATVLASILYYQRLRRAQREYEKARSAVEDVLLSLNRQFEREDKRLESIAYKVEALTSKADSSLTMSEDVSKRMGVMQSKISTEIEGRSQITQRLFDAEKKVGNLTASQETLMKRVSSLEQRPQQILTTPEVNLQGVIPIRREKAMSQLTNTEVSVLEMLAAEGSKTAPEIKERVKLSREHTARLMKNLYEEGYLERETGKIPFRYSVKKEMEKLLKKTESQASQSA
jgi:DNA-binding MarR family transcriptional regulator